MNIILKNNYLYISEFKLKCAIGKGGTNSNKIEGDETTPKGRFYLDKLLYRKDRVKKIEFCNDSKIIRSNYGWCDDIKSNYYNKLVKINNKTNFKYEKLFRNDSKYNYIIPIKYNYLKPKKNKGSAIFIHLTKDYKPTKGCIALSEKDFLIFCKLVNKRTKIIIN